MASHNSAVSRRLRLRERTRRRPRLAAKTASWEGRGAPSGGGHDGGLGRIGMVFALGRSLTCIVGGAFARSGATTGAIVVARVGVG